VLAGLPPSPSREVKSATSSAVRTPVSREHLRTLLGYLDADAPYPTWRDTVAAIRATPVVNDEDENERRQIALAFSRGTLDRTNRFKDTSPSRYTSDEAVLTVFDSMPPRENGVGFGTIHHAAKAE